MLCLHIANSVYMLNWYVKASKYSIRENVAIVHKGIHYLYVNPITYYPMARLLFYLGISITTLLILIGSSPVLEATPSGPEDCIASIPGSISPNGDGINDRFYIRYQCSIERYQLTVKDEEQHVVFSTENPNLYWDGSIQGTPLPQGYYFWELSYQASSQRFVRRGRVAIVR